MPFPAVQGSLVVFMRVEFSGPSCPILTPVAAVADDMSKLFFDTLRSQLVPNDHYIVVSCTRYGSIVRLAEIRYGSSGIYEVQSPSAIGDVIIAFAVQHILTTTEHGRNLTTRIFARWNADPAVWGGGACPLCSASLPGGGSVGAGPNQDVYQPGTEGPR